MFKPEENLDYQLRIQALRDYRKIVFEEDQNIASQGNSVSSVETPTTEDGPQIISPETEIQWFYWLLGEICEYAFLTVSKAKLSVENSNQQPDVPSAKTRFKWNQFQPTGLLKDGYIDAVNSCLSIAEEIFLESINEKRQDKNVSSLQTTVTGGSVTKRQIIEFFEKADDWKKKIKNSGIRSIEEVESHWNSLEKKKIGKEWRSEFTAKPDHLPWFVSPLVAETVDERVRERRRLILRILGIAFQAPISTFEHDNHSSPIGLPSISTEKIFEYVYNQEFSSIKELVDETPTRTKQPAPRPAELMTVMSQILRVMECDDKRQFLIKFKEEYIRIVSTGTSDQQDLELENLLILPK
jgi:hypothetical protein